MRRVEGRTFLMGSERFYVEERPCRPARVESFWIDESPVTNRQFAAFVAATGYRTEAELAPDVALYPGLPPELAHPGSLVFERTSGPVDLGDLRQWWHYRCGATWRHPLGAGSSTAGLEDHPVVHVTYRDAEAYASWADKSLPTEAEWECAARGGLEGAEFGWGDELEPGGQVLANYWRGEFPWSRDNAHGWERTSPVGCFPPNGYGIFDMIGNVWEWTSDGYSLPLRRSETGACCTPARALGAAQSAQHDPKRPARIPQKVLKGGSHLCAANYCVRYRPAARSPQAIDTSTCHVGFRCVVRD
jgi:formylglycine-generating enzyme required for sulfatase activity